MNKKLNSSFVTDYQYSSVKEKGVVLFIALIALVVMSLAAVALIRSVDTNAIIAGNLGFQQSATVSSDSGLETALTWISGNQGAVTANSAANAYYATSTGNAKALVDASTVFATGADLNAGKDSSGNTISYVIQRMCKNLGVAGTDHCLFGPVAESSNSFSVCDKSNPCLNEETSTSVIYRVTVKVSGPRNTVSYAQAFVY